MGLQIADEVQYQKDVDRFFELASILEVPVVKPKSFSISRWHPKRLPETPDELAEIVKTLGKPIEVQIQSAQSWGRNIFNVNASVYCMVNVTGTASFADGQINVKNTSGSFFGTTAYGVYSYEIVNSAYGDDTQHGIWLGTDDTPESFQDYGPIAKISHGETAGKLRYWNMFPIAISWSGIDRRWAWYVSRYFTNRSGGSITVREQCLIFRCRNQYITGVMCASRDVLASPIIVANYDLIRADYTIESAAFPS